MGTQIGCALATLQARFTEEVYPKVVRRATWYARRWPAWERDELTTDAAAYAWRIVASAVRRGIDPFACPWVVVKFATGHARSRLRLRTGARTLPREIEDKRQAAPSVRVELLDWLSSLPAKQRALAGRLGSGSTGRESAVELGLSNSEVIQLRKRLRANWARADLGQ